MVRARLHIICGNCGCNDMFEYGVDMTGHDFGDRFEYSVSIKCDNCGTIHGHRGYHSVLGIKVKDNKILFTNYAIGRLYWLNWETVKEKQNKHLEGFYFIKDNY